MPKPVVDNTYRCPKCRATVALVKTKRAHTNSDKVKCAVYECPQDGCDYEEGRPV